MAAARARRLGRIQSHDFRTAEDEPKPELTGMRLRLTTRSGGIASLPAYSNTCSQANARTSAQCFGDVCVYSSNDEREGAGVHPPPLLGTRCSIRMQQQSVRDGASRRARVWRGGG